MAELYRFVFGDVMIWSHVLAVRLRPNAVGTQVLRICGELWVPVASSIEEFWEGYLRKLGAAGDGQKRAAPERPGR